MRTVNLTPVIFNYLICDQTEREPDYSWTFALKEEEQWKQVVTREIQIRY